MGERTGWDIPPNVAGPGLCVVHRGTVVISPYSKIGRNCRIHACVNIGAWGGRESAPRIGDGCYIGPGAKLFGAVEIADDVVIGANAVVNKDVRQRGATVAGVPARIIKQPGTTR